MRIEDFNVERGQGTGRVSARVIWEDCHRDDEEVYFEVRDEAGIDGLTLNANAFLVGRVIPAMHYGEERVYVDDEICPQLEEGLSTALSVIKLWQNGRNCRLPQIEAKNRIQFPRVVSGRRAGCFFSGGVDSFATLRANHNQ
jgi:hypothetical protein